MEIVKGFFDYYIPDECIANKTYEKVVQKLYEYGYRTIAINQTINECNLEPKKKKKKGEPREVDIVPVPVEIKQVGGCEDMKILNRLTIAFSTQDVMYKIMRSPLYKKYNIIAVLPTSQQALQYVCSNIDADILTFDAEEKASYRCNRKLYNLLVSKGFHFEILYGPAILDSTQRKNTIHTAHLYHTFGKSKNIIVSSGASSPILIRGPYDVINLGLILGLNEEQSKNAITHCGRNVFVNSVGRRCGKVIMLVENIESEVQDAKMEEESSSDDDDEGMEIDQPAQKKIKS